MFICCVLMAGFAGLRRQKRQFETYVAAGFSEAVVQKVETLLFLLEGCSVFEGC